MKKEISIKLNIILLALLSIVSLFFVALIHASSQINKITEIYEASENLPETKSQNALKRNEINSEQQEIQNLNDEQEYANKLFKIEYYDYFLNGNYEIYEDNGLVDRFEYGVETQLTSISRENCTFVGWFGYDESSCMYFDNQGYLYDSILDNNLNLETSIKKINDILSKIQFYNEPEVQNEDEFYGKIVLYAKWEVNLSVTLEAENQEYEFVQDASAGVISIDEISNDLLPNVTKNVFLGSKIVLTAKPNDDYIFLGWYLKNEDEYILYESDKYIYEINTTMTKLELDFVNFDNTNFVARFVYKSYLISLEKILIDENNSTDPIVINKNDEYIIDASITRNNNVYEGKENLLYFGDKIVLRNNEKIEIQLNPNINYHLVDSGVSVINKLSNNESLNATYGLVNNQYILTLQNSGGTGYYEVILHFQKNYSTATLVYGSITSPNSFEGGDTEFVAGFEDEYGNMIYSSFNLQTNKQTNFGEERIVSKTANIYFGTDIEISINTREGYKFESSLTEISYVSGLDITYDFLYEGNKLTKIKIYNVTGDLDISLVFTKLYKLTFEVNSVVIDGVSRNAGQIKVNSNNFTSGTIKEYIDGGSSVSFEVAQVDYHMQCVFNNWIVKDADGNEIDYEDFGVTPNEITNSYLTLKNIYEDLYITAVFVKRTYTVSVIWNGQNGSIETDENYINKNDVFELEYGDTITFKMTPKSEKYLIGDLYLQTIGDAVRTNFDTYSTLKIRNIATNQRVILSFVADTWYLHLVKFEFEGKGTSDVPYIIKDASDLALLSYVINNNIEAGEEKVQYSKAYYQLKNDIDMGTDYFFVPIGTTESPFAGTFDYNYFAIENLTTEFQSENYINDGLFDKMDGTGKIIKQFRSKVPLMMGLAGIAIVILIAFGIVFRIERKRQRPKKVFVLQIEDDQK